MRKAITINIPEPCHENWYKMTTAEKGRHCDVCTKTVYDFTSMNDEQLIKTLEHNSNLCGRFNTEQIGRKLILNRKRKNSFSTLLASGLFAFFALSAQEGKAQNKPKIVQIDSLKANKTNSKISTSLLKQRVIQGAIIGKEDQLPLPGVNVVIKGTARGVQTDFDGKFSIRVRNGETLVFSYLGFATKELIITPKTNLKDIALELEDAVLGGMILGELAVESLHNTKTLSKKQRRAAIREGEIERTNLGKLLYKISNPFRRKKQI